MRVVFTDDLADDARRFAVAAVPLVAVHLHRVEDAAVDRLQPVAHIGQRARHDYAHCVIEVGAPHLLFDRDGSDIGCGRGCGTYGQSCSRVASDELATARRAAAGCSRYGHPLATLPYFAGANKLSIG